MFKYLDDKIDELTNLISEKNKEIDSINYTLREDERFVELLEKEKVVPFVEFTPKVITKGEKKKQIDMHEKINALNAEKELIIEEVKILEAEIQALLITKNEIKGAIVKATQDNVSGKTDLIARLKSAREFVISYPQKSISIIDSLINDYEDKK